MDSGNDLYFTHHAGTPFTQPREEIEIHSRGGKLECDAEVVLAFHREVKPQDQVIPKTNLLHPLEDASPATRSIK